MFRRQQLRLWETEWRQNNADTDLFKWVPLVSETPHWFPPNQALVTLLTGHGRFHSYFHRFGLLAEPLCSCGATCEATDHYLYDCPLTTNITTMIQPRHEYDQRRYPSLLRQARNRALFIRLVKLVADMIPDLH
ncbi:hypothetical protein HPB50_006875 [Hyalomma asiaticum]|uniref:Uncharacterized protein n=1 Tax=Hyalomma asiaticum TaxID=266040 RepID=A0ACB7T1Q3_HYAAI|nr:hypothetical protein HPB50_006875 [Hyalomma asiaticum]